MRILTLTKAALAGAAAMYLFDPDRGRARRARIRDQGAKLVRESERAIDILGRDLSNRIHGTMAHCAGMLACHAVDDETLVARVRTKLGRLSRHPSAIEVAAHEGRIVLSGHILSEEAQCVVRAIACVPGVAGVDNHLDVHQHAEDADALRGGRTVQDFGILPPWRTWSPTARFGLALGGLGLLTRSTALPLLIGGTAAALAVACHPAQRSPSAPTDRSLRTETEAPVPAL